jgi:hypothetical protein
MEKVLKIGRIKYCFSIFYRGCNQSNLSTIIRHKVKKKEGKYLSPLKILQLLYLLLKINNTIKQVKDQNEFQS